MSWQIIDIVIVTIIALSVVTGLLRGFVKELIALCVWILAIWLAFKYSANVSLWLQPYIKDKTARTAVAFVMILLGAIVAGGLCNAILSFILHRSGLSGTDRLLGMGFGFIRGVFIVALLMLVVKIADIPYQSYVDQSRLYARFNPLVDWLTGFMPGFIKQAKMYDKDSSATDKNKPQASPLPLSP